MKEWFSGLGRLRPTAVLHKIWIEGDGAPLPDAYRHTLDVRRPVGCSTRFWSSRDDVQEIIDNHASVFPFLAQCFWQSWISPVMRSDILRLLILFDQGGLYGDHDLEWGSGLPRGPYDLMLVTEEVHDNAAVERNMKMTREHRGESPEYHVRIANYCIYAPQAGSKLLARCLVRVQQRLQENERQRISTYGVLYMTGPDALTDTVVEGLTRPDTLMPFAKCLTRCSEWIDRDGERILLLSKKEGRRLAGHQMHGKWRGSQKGNVG